MMTEVGDRIDRGRIHFTGKIPHASLRALMAVSSAHVYLTYPFVLSWSMIEAMASGCLVIGSRTAPVEEVIRHGENGLLVDFFSPGELAEAVCRALAEPAAVSHLRAAARRTAVERYDLARVCLPGQLAVIDALATGRTPAR